MVCRVLETKSFIEVSMWKSAALAAIIIVGAGLSGACDDSTGPETNREYLSSQVNPRPVNVLSAEVEVRAVGYDSVLLRYARAGEAARRTPAYAFGPDSVARPALLGLAANSVYTVEVVLVGPGETVVEVLDTTTGALPAWIPTVTPLGTDTTPGFLVLSIPDGPVIVDNQGTVVWYRYDPDITLVNFQAHPSGEYTTYGLTNEIRAYRVLDELGRETGQIECVDYEIRPHEIRIRADGTRWALCNDVRVQDLTEYGGAPNSQVIWTVLQKLSPEGILEWEWNSADHFEVTDGANDIAGGPLEVNLTHGNAVDFDADGNLLASFRNLNEVTKIDAQTGDIIWRMGGKNNEFAFPADPKGAFQRQHGLRVVEPGVIQLLDNSDFPPSRLLRYSVDESARTATLQWQYIDGPEIQTLVGGNTQVYADGGALVSFGREGRVVEVDELGQKRWELTGIDDLYVFRAQRIPSLYAAERTAAP
jgi:outer membrane protein assembly factor BamB